MKPKALSPIEAHQAIERLLDGPAPLALTQHARERMRDRRFTTDDILRVLRYGVVSPNAVWDDRRRTWHYKVSDRDGEPLSVVVAIEDRIVVITGHA